MMAATNLSDANSAAASANHSPRHSAHNISSPKSRRRATSSSPWNQIVRGELDSIAVSSSPSAVVEPVSSSFSSSSSSLPSAVDEPVCESVDGGNGSAGNVGKKPAWNKLANGAVAVESGPVMGAVSWPALSESAKNPTKASSDSLKSLADGSAGQGAGTPSSSSNKEGNNDVVSPTHDSTLTHPMTSRQKSMRRNGFGNSYNSGLPQQSALSSPLIDTTPNNSSKDQTQRTAFASQAHNDHGHQQPRNSFSRSRGGGSHPRGDNSHHHNHGGRRDHDRGNQDWNSNRNFNSQPHRVVHRFIRPPPPPNTAPFIPPPPMRPLGGPIPFSDFAPPMVYVGPPPPPEALRGVPFVTSIPPNAMFYPAIDPQLPARIVKQIDYYFSGENLVKDTFLRKKMNEHGWVPIRLIASFKKVSCLTDNIQLILDSLQSSTVVEAKGDKVRRRNDYDRWIIRPPSQVRNVAGPPGPGNSSQDMLAAGVQVISLENNHIGTEGGQGDAHVEAPHSSRPHENLSMQVQPYGDDGTSQVNIKTGSDHSSSERT